MSGQRLAAAAEALIGVPFRLHGRDPAHGLDCVGVLAASLRAIGRDAALPRGYSLRLLDPLAWLPGAAATGFAQANGPPAPGDVLVLQVGPAQAHVAIVVGDGALVHAHAGLRRVVKTPADPATPVIAHWRIEKDKN